MKKVSKRTIRFFVAGAFFLLTFFPLVSGGFAGEEKVVYGASYSPAVLRAGGEQLEEAEVVVELEEKFHQSQTYREIAQERAELIAENPDDLAEQLDALLTEQRAACKDFYAQKKEAFYREIGLDESYFEGSAYSGFLTVVPEELAAQPRADLFVDRLAKSEMTCKISVGDPHTLEPAGWFGSWEGETLPTIHGENLADWHTGEGIKVGVLEVGGVVDTNFFINNYPGMSVITKSNTIAVSDHATRVGAIIAALAPECTLYSAQVDIPELDDEAPMVDDLEDGGVDWLNASNVQIVNCSFVAQGFHEDIDYCGLDAMYNNYAVDNAMTFVFAAGNESNSYVSCPNEGANIITVGATDNNGSTKAGYSNYGSKTGLVKPLMVGNGAPHIPYLNDPFHTQYGTSFAAPMVTGALVLAAQNNSLMQYPNYAIPTLVSTATHEGLSGGTFESNGIVNNYFGYGMLDINTLIINNFSSYYHVLFPEDINNPVSNTETMLIDPGYKVRACLYWMSEGATKDGSDFTNYNLRVYDPNGNLVASSTSTNRNMEAVEFTASVYGTYTFKISKIGSTVETSGNAVILHRAFVNTEDFMS